MHDAVLWLFMKPKYLITSQGFGITASISIALMTWFFATVNNLCYSDSAIGPVCVSSSLMDKLIERQVWPLHFPPFSIHWDVYDDKFAWLIAEPYFQLIVIAITIYLIWFGFRYHIRRQGDASIKANIGNVWESLSLDWTGEWVHRKSSWGSKFLFEDLVPNTK